MTVGEDRAQDREGSAIGGILGGLLVLLGIGALVLLFVFVVWYISTSVGTAETGAFNIGILGAALAGLISFLSPCVLPLVLPYLGYLGGTTVDEMTNTNRRTRAPTASSTDWTPCRAPSPGCVGARGMPFKRL